MISNHNILFHISDSASCKIGKVVRAKPSSFKRTVDSKLRKIDVNSDGYHKLGKDAKKVDTRNHALDKWGNEE